MAVDKHPCGFEGLLVHSWVQTLTNEFRPLCKHPRGTPRKWEPSHGTHA